MSKTAMTQPTFVDEVLSGNALIEDIDDWVEGWHSTSDGYPTLWEHLGMTTSEYALWVEQPEVLRFVVAAHRQGVAVEELLTSQRDYALAARADDPEDARQVVLWLVKTNRIDPNTASHL